MKLLQSISVLHQTQTKQSHLNSPFVPESPADLENAISVAVIDFKEITRHFPLSKIIYYAPIESGRLYCICLPKCKKEKRRHRAGKEGERIQIY